MVGLVMPWGRLHCYINQVTLLSVSELLYAGIHPGNCNAVWLGALHSCPTQIIKNNYTNPLQNMAPALSLSNLYLLACLRVGGGQTAKVNYISYGDNNWVTLSPKRLDITPWFWLAGQLVT